MVEIKITDTPSDTLESKYICVDNIFMLNDKCDNLEDSDSYQLYEDNYIDASSALESIINLGNHLICKFDLSNINDVLLHENDLKTQISEWLLLNPYPYASLLAIDRCYNSVSYQLAEDIVLCTIIYSIHKWLVKIYKDKDTIIAAPSKSKELDNLEACLNFINFDKIIKDNYNIDKELAPFELDLYIDKKETIIHKLDLIRNRVFNLETADMYCRFITDCLISILPRFIYSLGSADIKEQVRVFDSMTNEYQTMYKMRSILGIVCNEIENMLISKSINGRIICGNPNCNNDFDSNCGQRFCKSVKCQKYRNNIKSKASYDRKQEAKKKASQLND